MTWSFESWSSCHTLLRLIISCYYSLDHVAIVNSFLSLLLQANLQLLQDTTAKGQVLLLDESARVSESEIAMHCSLGQRKVREALMRLKTDGLIRSAQKQPDKPNSKNDDTVSVSEMSSSARQQLEKLRRRHIAANQSKLTVYWVDWFQLVKTLKYNHLQMFQEIQRREQQNQSEEFYTCPTINCSNYQRAISVMDLLLQQQSSSAVAAVSTERQVFRCDLCYTEKDEQKMYTELIMKDVESTMIIKQQDGRSTEMPTSLKARFNRLIAPIVQQMKVIDDILQKLLIESAEDTINKTVRAVTGKTGQSHTVTTTADQQQIGTQQTQGNRILHKPDTQILKVKFQALPWQGNPASLQQLQSIQQKQEEEEKLKRQHEENQARQRQEKAAFEERMKAEIDRMQKQQLQQLSTTSTTVEQTAAQDESVEFEDPILHVGGVEYHLSSITAAEVTAMTDEEFAIYESYIATQQTEDGQDEAIEEE